VNAPERTLVVGIGNARMGDDGVGVAVVRQLCRRLGGTCRVDLLELESGGMRLMEILDGYDRAFIVDAVLTGEVPPGTIRPLGVTSPGARRNAISTRDTDLFSALEVGRSLGLNLPKTVQAWGIEAASVDVCTERLSDRVQAAVPRMVDLLTETVAGEGRLC
jgi:hydrogenase maturation protease